jgi:geranylgeranyl diphosphate synthase type I
MGSSAFDGSDEYFAAIEAYLKESVDSSGPALSPYYGMIRYHLGWVDRDFAPTRSTTGKRLRPLLCLLSCEACGGEWSRALPAAVAIELIHNFSLIHDDIEDDSPVRRHRPTVWSLWGRPQAINVGDGLFAISRLTLQRLKDGEVGAGKVIEAFRIVDETCLRLTEGQHLDLAFEDRDLVTVEMYMEMIGKKTAALMGCATHLGALLASDDRALVERYQRFGHQLGLLFQIVDDILGIWGAGELTGKGIGEDIASRKKSLPAVYALEKNQRLRELYQKDGLDISQQKQVMDLLEEVGSREYAEQKASEQLRLALGTLDEAQIDNRAQQRLREIARFLRDRQY